MFHIDVWQSHQSGISVIGWSSCVNRRIAHVGWRPKAGHVGRLTGKSSRYEIIYISYPQSHGQSRSSSWSHNQIRPEAGLGATQGAVADSGTRFRSTRQGSKDIWPWIWNDNLGWEKVNIAALRQSVSTSFVDLSLSVSLSRTPISNFSRNKESDIFL